MLEDVQENSGTSLLFRLILDGPADGAWNMALDEALMESSGTEGNPPSLRFYTFSPPALSVGRFQKTGGVFDFECLEDFGYTFVRRPSGGQAVLHSEELTYSAAVGKHVLGRLGKRDIYRFIVPILLAGLSELGLESFNEAPGGNGVSTSPDCFASTGQYEIDGNSNRKLIGSAQMVSRTSVLQHGSIPLTSANRKLRDFLLPDVEENRSSSISEELNRTVSFDEAEAAFSRAAGSILQLRQEEITTSERRRAEELLETRYLSTAWNMKY
jgi:lipoyl(octanoyl) transferase